MDTSILVVAAVVVIVDGSDGDDIDTPGDGDARSGDEDLSSIVNRCDLEN